MKTFLRSLLEHLTLVAFVVFLVACIAYPGYSVVYEQVDLSHTQTLTNKTLIAPVIGTIVNVGTLTLPTSTDTLVGRATTDTLTNKVLSSPGIASPQYSGTSSGIHTYNMSTLAGSAIGTYTFGGTPTIIAPAISSPVLSGTTTGTYTLAGTPTIASPTISSPTISSATLTSPTVSTGPLTLTSGQLAFPATQAASAGANTLDDYEEGTWTPSIGGSATYSTQDCVYTKIGRMVFISCYFQVNSLGTGSTTTISGLPFTAAKYAALSVSSSSSLAVSPVSFAGEVSTSGTTITFQGRTAGATASSQLAIFGNSTLVVFSGSYITAT